MTDCGAYFELKKNSVNNGEKKMRTGFVYHDDYLLHDAGTWHPESPARLKSIYTHLSENRFLENLIMIKPIEPDVDWISTVHTPEYIVSVRQACDDGVAHLDADTGICRDSYRAALLAVGGVLSAIDSVVSSEINNAFCALRPPGHHAEKDRAMGFCLFNNVAIGAKYIQQKHALPKVLIIDWDVHHGNGTQHAFYSDASVFYFSVHQHPHYPGTGFQDDEGSGEGVGTTLNIPMSAGSDDADYINAFEKRLVPAMARFAPDFILISAGFDAHRDDPLAGMNLTEDGYAQMTSITCSLAEQYCGGKLVSLLEGGYHLDSLAACTASHLKEMMSRT